MNRSRPQRPTIVRESHSRLECVTLAHQVYSELHIVARPQAGESVSELYDRTVALCHQRQAAIASMTVFAPPGESAFTNDGPPWPVTHLLAVPQATGLIAYALADVPLRTLFHEGRAAGSLYEIAGVRYCRLAGIVAPRAQADPAEEAAAIFEGMESLLRGVDLDFRNAIRTWFFNADILSWYDPFNRARDAFFAARGIRGAAAPASTGIGIANPSGRALAAELLAVAGAPAVQRIVVPSPLQCPAVDYGSSFSRALELETPSRRTLYISGTASIAPDGRTEFVGDPENQIGRTMQVVEALLSSRGMTWTDAVRAIAFFKHISDLPRFLAYCARNRLSSLPVLSVEADVCRPELLFELELEATVWK